MDHAPGYDDELTVEVVSGRRPWLIALAIALVVIGGLALIGRFLERQEISSLAFSEPIDGVSVDTNNGDIIIVASAVSETQVDWVATYSVIAPDPVAIVESGKLEIAGGCPGFSLPFIGGCRVDFRVTVPAGMIIEADSANGDVEVEGIIGSLSAETSNGDVIGRRLAARTVRANTSNGSVNLIFTQAPERVTADTSNGAITIEVPDVPFRVEADTDNGRVTLDVVADPDAARVIEATSNNGDITIRRS
jgi:hypothetical protein